MNEQETRRWTVVDSAELYEVGGWGKGYFSVNEAGNVCVHPEKDPQQKIDLKQLVDQLQARQIELPVLIRFGGVLKQRLGEIHAAFQAAINEQQYQGTYQCIYPIKVNQQRQVVEEVVRFGETYHYGLEAGSKPELLAVVAMANDDAPIICNGFKDAEYIEIALLAQKIGRQVFIVIEKYTDLELILRVGGENRRPADDRRAGEAGFAGGRPLARFRRFPLQVRPLGQRNAPRAGGTQGPRHGRLLPPPALSPRQPDLQHPHDQAGPERGGADLRRSGQARRRLAVP